MEPKLTSKAVIAALTKDASPERAEHNKRFFKTAPGEYGHGDKFIGTTVPAVRAVVRTFATLPLPEVEKLLASTYHEHRLAAVLMLDVQYAKAKTDATRKAILTFYLQHLERINNWDLVDTSAPQIVGAWLLTHDRKKLYTLAQSKDLWSRRVAIIATLTFIRAGEVDDTLALAEIFLTDRHDLMHKATGWMLREAHKRKPKEIEAFLEQHAHHMPRTALRYAIERMSEKQRAHFLTAKKILR